MSTTQKKKYAGAKRSTTISVNGNLVDAALKYFPSTRHRSVSGWFDNALKRELRAVAPKLRKLGIKLPEEVFAK